MEFLHMDNVRWVEACLETLGKQLNPGGVNEPARAGYIYLVMEMIESSNAAARRWAVSSLASLLIWDEYDVKPQYISALIAGLQDDGAQGGLALQALQEWGEAYPWLLAQHADALVARLKDDNQVVRRSALLVLAKLEPATLAPHAEAVVAMLEDSIEQVRCGAVDLLAKLEPATLAPHAEAVVAMLEDSIEQVRCGAVDLLAMLEPETLAQHAVAVVAILENSAWGVRATALEALGKLEPAALAQHAHVVLARLEDSKWYVRMGALVTLGKLEPASLAQYADAVVARLEDSDDQVREHSRELVRSAAVETLGKLDPVRFAQYADAVIDKLDDDSGTVRSAASNSLMRALPQAVTRGLNLDDGDAGRSQLRARLRWYKHGLHFRLRRIALRWYALPYRPGGAGCARDVEEWGQMIGNADQSTTTAPTKRHKMGGD